MRLHLLLNLIFLLLVGEIQGYILQWVLVSLLIVNLIICSYLSSRTNIYNFTFMSTDKCRHFLYVPEKSLPTGILDNIAWSVERFICALFFSKLYLWHIFSVWCFGRLPGNLVSE